MAFTYLWIEPGGPEAYLRPKEPAYAKRETDKVFPLLKEADEIINDL